MQYVKGFAFLDLHNQLELHDSEGCYNMKKISVYVKKMHAFRKVHTEGLEILRRQQHVMEKIVHLHECT